jgi:predicted nuclease with TOPRIM domain
MWTWLIYAALAAGAVAILAALVFLAVRVLRAWRDLKRLRRHLAKELDRLADRAEVLADSAARAGDTTQLQERLDHLRVTLARFTVLREAFDEATGAVTSVTAFMPRK